jgi:two-component system LytT family response regulator
MIVKLKAILVEDEPLAIKGFTKYIQKNNFIELAAVCENAMEAFEVLEAEKIELMFLDIHMPKINGIEFLASLKKRPLTIITSAIPPSALILKGLNVIDYLVKPTSPEKFNLSINKAWEKKLNTLT